MNAKDLTFLRKQFKPQFTLAQIDRIYSVYINKDTNDIIDQKEMSFKLADDSMKEILLSNVKKALTGTFGSRLFKQSFDEELKQASNNTFSLINTMLKSEDESAFIPAANAIVEKIRNNFNYKSSIVIIFYKFKIFNDMNAFDFVMGTVNNVEPAEQNFIYDFVKRDFLVQSHLDAIVGMDIPLEGFMYPVFEEDTINMDNLLEFNPKTNGAFTYGVLECTSTLTSKEEKECFHQILSEVTDGQIEPKKLKDIYKVIDERFEGKEDRRLTPMVLDNVLNDLDIEHEAPLEEAYTKTVSDEKYTFNVDSILPDKKAKSIQLQTSDAEIKIKPQNLDSIKQIRNSRGEVFALIKLNENLTANGMNIAISSIEELSDLIEGQ